MVAEDSCEPCQNADSCALAVSVIFWKYHFGGKLPPLDGKRPYGSDDKLEPAKPPKVNTLKSRTRYVLYRVSDIVAGETGVYLLTKAIRYAP
jgi:hypothetical protein